MTLTYKRILLLIVILLALIAAEKSAFAQSATTANTSVKAAIASPDELVSINGKIYSVAELTRQMSAELPQHITIDGKSWTIVVLSEIPQDSNPGSCQSGKSWSGMTIWDERKIPRLFI